MNTPAPEPGPSNRAAGDPAAGLPGYPGQPGEHRTVLAPHARVDWLDLPLWVMVLVGLVIFTLVGGALDNMASKINWNQDLHAIPPPASAPVRPGG